MTQLELAATTVPMRHVQGSEPLAIPADALCVLAPGHDAARDHVVRDDAPRGRVRCRCGARRGQGHALACPVVMERWAA